MHEKAKKMMRTTALRMSSDVVIQLCSKVHSNKFKKSFVLHAEILVEDRCFPKHAEECLGLGASGGPHLMP